MTAESTRNPSRFTLILNAKLRPGSTVGPSRRMAAVCGLEPDIIRSASVRPQHVVASHQAMRPSVRFSPLARNPPLVPEALRQLIASQAPGDSQRRLAARRGQSPVDADLVVEQAQ